MNVLQHEAAAKLDQWVEELVRNYPFYQSVTLDRGEGHLPLIEQLPLVDKQMIGSNRTLFELPGTGKLIETFTSGTTGVPFRCTKTPEERAALSLVLYKHRRKWGLPAKHRMILLSERLLSDSKALEHYAKMIRRDRPHMIQGRATALVALAQYMKEQGHGVPEELLFVQNWGEQLHPAQKEIVEKHLGVPFIDYYGMEEFWCIAFTNRQGELEVDTRSVYVEIIDPETGRVLPNGEFGEVVVTSLLMRSLSFARYRTGDIGRLTIQPKAGSGDLIRTLQLLPVRSSQIKLPGRTVPAALFRYLDRMFWELSVTKGIRQYQFVQETYTSFRLLMVADSDMSEDPVLKPKIGGFLRQCLGQDVTCTLENVQTIAPNPRSGKVHSFISHVS